jgi:hypothetical protein
MFAGSHSMYLPFFVLADQALEQSYPLQANVAIADQSGCLALIPLA